MSSVTIPELADAFISDCGRSVVLGDDLVLRKRDTSDTEWVHREIFRTIYNRPEDWWKFILEVLDRTNDRDVLAVLAAGPVEDYLVRFGEEQIGLVEKQAAVDTKFRQLLGGVWRNSMSESVWSGVCACRGEE